MHLNGLPPRRRRIAHITLGLDTGGQEKLLAEFARHADRRRFELFFLSLTSRGVLAKTIEALDWPVVALEEPQGFRPDMALRILPWLRRWRIDVLHTHDCKPLLYGALAARLAGVARIVHMRHFADLPSLTRRQKWLATLAARLVDDYVCVSEASARQAISEGVWPQGVRRIWNGIDTERFAWCGPQPEGPAVTVARLSPEKDLATLLHAVALVVRQQPAFRLEIAGKGPCLPELRRLTHSLGLAGHVAFLGEVHDVPGLLARGRLFVLPSLTEGISLTLLEAMARGLPVVATRAGGNPEVVQHGETGWLVPPADPAALADALLQLYGDPGRGDALGRAGRLRVERNFEVRRMVAAYEKLYTSQVRTRQPLLTGRRANVLACPATN
jgi:glycosyltransferase involved in cell wall biosynthesis